MRLLDPLDMPRVGSLRTYRHALGPYLICGAVGLAFSGAALYELLANDGGLLLWLPVFGGLFLAMICLSMARAALRQSNWLLRLFPEGVYLQFRSYLNWHLPESEPTIVFIPNAEIAGVGVTRTTYSLPDKEDATESKSVVSIDFELIHGQTEALAAALAAERGAQAAGTVRVKTHDYPVRLVAPDCVRVDWRVKPNATKAVAELAEFLPMREPVRVVWPSWDRLEDVEREALIRELSERGDTMKAARLAEMYFEMSHAEAQALVERWMVE